MVCMTNRTLPLFGELEFLCVPSEVTKDWSNYPTKGDQQKTYYDMKWPSAATLSSPNDLNHISKILLGWLQTLEPVRLHAIMGKKERREYCSEARGFSISNAFLRHFHAFSKCFNTWLHPMERRRGRALNWHDLFKLRHAWWWFQPTWKIFANTRVFKTTSYK